MILLMCLRCIMKEFTRFSNANIAKTTSMCK